MYAARLLLAATALATATACTSSEQLATAPAAATTPTAVTASAPNETLAPLLSQALPNAKGKTFTSAIVSFPPGAHAVPHRHGQALVYA